jgi:CheY-like chemotaxis protein/HPt (histidine-containing phosphotransfer) domain-containing protein/anti-sigma regulatory factor (Ser/Thr protein kinase)
MNGILGMTRLLLDTRLSPEQHDYVRTIHSSGETLMAILDDILDTSKIEAGRMELEQRPFALAPMAEGCLALLATRAAEHDNALALYLDPSLPSHVVGDEVRVRQILSNLLSNALKFTTAGSVTVTLRADPEGDADHLRLEVTDTGEGISEAAQARLFTEYAQADASTARRFGGTGLGLSICKRLAELMDGTIDVNSAPGAGSTFWVRLRLPPAEDARTVDGDAGEEAGPAEVARLAGAVAGRRVLIAEARPPIAAVYAQQLRDWGAVVSVAASFDDAAAQARADPGPNLLLAGTAFADAPAEMTRTLVAHAGGRLPAVVIGGCNAREGPRDAEVYGGPAVMVSMPARAAILARACSWLLSPETVTPSWRPAVEGQADVVGQRRPMRALAVLLAEDNPVNQVVARGFLEKHGHRVRVAETGKEAVALAQDETFDVVLMDQQMPEMDGLEATRRLREVLNGPTRLPIIALTAAVGAHDVAQCRAAGMDDFVAKPIEPDALLDAFERVLGERVLGERVLGDQVRADGVGATETGEEAGETADDGHSAIDWSLLEKRRGELGETTGARLLRNYLQMVQARRAALIETDPTEGREALERAAHSMKSSAGSVGLVALSAACAEIEAECRDGHPERAAARQADLPALLNESERALEAYLARLAPADAAM